MGMNVPRAHPPFLTAGGPSFRALSPSSACKPTSACKPASTEAGSSSAYPTYALVRSRAAAASVRAHLLLRVELCSERSECAKLTTTSA
eukprot:CAMPEP_0179838296 /NCGR_PEP_ID=MMETSP0982-20121206/598_1 /TAXON_ID=483367 /ORGANISM="non described non described, Strain CCMP 2436" /LENGTH=88 /DNA_ID=CAMNT_0021721653 /DNA_START=1260 /DNA_END=1522 /DNA_ORIENTATION=+